MAWNLGLPWGKRNGSETSTVHRFGDLVGWLGFGGGAAPALSAESALDSAAVLGAVKVIVEGIGQTPLRLIEETEVNGRTKRRIAKEHWAHKLLAKRPNSWQTSGEFIEAMAINAVLGKGALAIKNMDKGANPRIHNLYPVPSGSWEAQVQNDHTTIYRVQYANNQHEYFHQSQVLFIRGISLDSRSGVSSIERARKAVGISNALEDQQLKLSASGGRPSGVLTFEKELSADTKAKLRETWQTRWGAGGEGGIAVLDGAAKFDSIALSAADSQFIENRRFQIEEICRIFRVQPIMLMQSDKAATFASAEQMFRMHVTHTLMPWFRRFEQALNRDILGNSETLEFDFDERELLRGDAKSQGEYMQKALGGPGTQGWISINEARFDEGRDPFDDPKFDLPVIAGAASLPVATSEPEVRDPNVKEGF